ncbi:MAG: DNA repair protein RadC [Saprospiraceae bacterium]|nr:DNA repair protein RadC [Saprospiraceae bacterium]
MTTPPLKNSIKLWAEDDRPREKLAAKGKEALSNVELLAILLGSGSRNESAVDLARRILFGCQNSLLELSKLGINGLKKYKGVGLAKAISIEAALELARRRPLEEAINRYAVKASVDAYDHLRLRMEDLKIEQCWVIYLNRASAIIHSECISTGGLSGTVVDPRIVFKKALELSASSIILAHNHPSGNLQPSQQDDRLTDQVKSAGAYLDIRMTDHLIISEKGYYSYADEGKL